MVLPRTTFLIPMTRALISFLGKEFTLAGLNYLRDTTDQLIDKMNHVSEQNIQQQQSQKQIHEQYYEGMHFAHFECYFMSLLDYTKEV